MKRLLQDSAFFEEAQYLFFMQPIMDRFTDGEVRFLLDKLAIDKSSDVLDVPCGYARHTVPLASYARSILGLDSNQYFIELARKRAREVGAKAEFQVYDVRQLHFQCRFDRILCLFGSFGIFSHVENLRTLDRLSAALRPGGLICLDFLTPNVCPHKDGVTGQYAKYWVFEHEGGLMVDQKKINPKTARLELKRSYFHSGQELHSLISFELFDFDSVRRMLAARRLEVVQAYENFSGSAVRPDSQELLIIAKRLQ